MLCKMFRSKKGQGLVEYGLIIAGVALISAASVSIFGHKTSDLIAACATVIPCGHGDDNGPIVSGKLIETGTGGGTVSATNGLELDTAGILGASNEGRLGNNVLGDGAAAGFGGLVLELDDDTDA